MGHVPSWPTNHCPIKTVCARYTYYEIIIFSLTSTCAFNLGVSQLNKQRFKFTLSIFSSKHSKRHKLNVLTVQNELIYHNNTIFNATLTSINRTQPKHVTKGGAVYAAQGHDEIRTKTAPVV